MSLDLSIVIPIINEWPHIFYTVHSVMLDLEDENISYEIMIVDNGSEPEEKEKIDPLCKHYPIELISYSPQSVNLALREGIRKAKGKVICYLNAHSLFSKGFFSNNFGLIDKGEVDGVFTPVSYGWSWPLDSTHTKVYQYYLEPYCGDEKFGVGYSFDKLSEKHYLVAAQANHGFTFIRDAWFKIGEVNEGLLYAGGGDEIYISLKMWMFGFKLALNPNVTTIHFNSPRRYPPTPNYYAHRNSFITYYTLGGEEYAKTLLKTHVLRSLKNPGYAMEQFGSKLDDPSDIYECLEEAKEHSEQERKFIEQKANIPFEELWKWFDDNGVYWRK